MREYLVRTIKEALILLLTLMLFPNNEITMNYLIATNLLCSLVAVLTNPSPKLATADSGVNTGKAQSDMINNYYSERHCKKIEQHLLEIICTFIFYFVIKIGTKDTNASLIVLYLSFILFWRAKDILYHFGVIRDSLFNFQFSRTAQKS